FCSSQHLRALLAAGDDQVAESALRCLMLLTVPPLLHRHQQPELNNMCSIDKDKVVSAELTTLSGGWGGRGQGLGLLACVTGRVEGEQEEEQAQVSASGGVIVCYAPAAEAAAEAAPESAARSGGRGAGAGAPETEEGGEGSNRAPSPGG
ncbi:unnamed protein product, partial [Hapterophycus canaliculatus]